MPRAEAWVAVRGGVATGVRTVADRVAADRLHHLELVATALLVMLWIDLVRVWFPTVAAQTVWPTPPTAARSFTATALLAAGAALLGMAPLPRGATRHRFALAAGALIAVRTSLAFGPPGGRIQLILAGVGVAAGLVALVESATASPQPRRVRLGIAAGVLGAVVVHAGTATRGLIWAPTGWTMVVSLLLVVGAGVTAASLWTHRGVTDAIRREPGSAPVAASWPWWSLTPLLVLVLVLSGVPGRTMVATGWSPSTAAMTVAAIHLGAAVVVAIRPRLPRVPLLALVTLGLPAAVLAASDGQGWSVVIGQSGVAIGVALLVSAPEPEPTGRQARLPGFVPGAALTLTLVAVGLYHLADERIMLLGNVGVHALVGLLGSVIAVALMRVGPTAVVRPRIDVPRLLALTATAGMLAVAIGALNPRTMTIDTAAAPPTDELRVALLNVGSGFDPQGRFVAGEQGRFLADLDLDVVVLTEVDRGRLVAGGHDGLQIIAAELGFDTIVFAPAADQASGLALLTRLDVAELAREQLPTGNDPQRHGSLAAVVSWPGDAPLGLIGTQLSDHQDQGETRLTQARSVAGTVALLRERQVPTVVLADLRADAGSPELGTFTSLLHDALPAGTSTVPADAPERRDEHVLLSPELRRTDVGLPRVAWSDRLPLIVTLERVEPLD